MSRLFYQVMQDNVGNLLFDVSGTMRLAGTGTLATIYGDEALTVILPNPMTNHASFGSFKCFLGAGDYDFYMAKAGYTFETLTGVQGHGTMAQQDAANVAISGGTVTGLVVPNTPGSDVVGLYGTMDSAGGTNRWFIRHDGNAPTYLAGTLQVMGHMALGSGAPIQGDRTINIIQNRGGEVHAMVIQAAGNDTGGYAVLFLNTAASPVGAIAYSSTATSYGTSSDARLKHAITALTGALPMVQALRPVAFRWNADDSPGHGFLAHELQQVIPDAVSGLPDAVNEDGSVRPQQVDHSRLVPWLTAALQETMAQVQALTARVAALEAGNL